MAEGGGGGGGQGLHKKSDVRVPSPSLLTEGPAARWLSSQTVSSWRTNQRWPDETVSP